MAEAGDCRGLSTAAMNTKAKTNAPVERSSGKTQVRKNSNIAKLAPAVESARSRLLGWGEGRAEARVPILRDPRPREKRVRPAEQEDCKVPLAGVCDFEIP